MNDRRDAHGPEDGLTPEERQWLEQVPEKVDPPPELRDRVLEELEWAGQIRSRAVRPDRGPAPWPYRPLAVAAGLVLAFLAGGLIGRVTAPGAGNGAGSESSTPGVVAAVPDDRAIDLAAAPAGESHYMLLLYEGAGYAAPGRSREDLVTEYTAWANGLEDAGALVAAERLSDDAGLVPFPGSPGLAGGSPVSATSPLASPGGATVVGFFIVRADSYEEAARLARESPHVAYGGRVVIRRIDGS